MHQLRLMVSCVVHWSTLFLAYELSCEFITLVACDFLRSCQPRIREVLNECGGDAFFVRQYARQVACEMTYLARQRGFALCTEGVSDVEPALGDCLAGFKQCGDEWLSAYRKPRTLWSSPNSLIAGDRRTLSHPNGFADTS